MTPTQFAIARYYAQLVAAAKQRRLTEREEELLPVLALCVARYQADESKLKGAHPHD